MNIFPHYTFMYKDTVCIFMFIHRKNILLLSKIVKTQFVSENLNIKTPRKNNFVWVITHELKDVLSGSISLFLWKSILLYNFVIKINYFPIYTTIYILNHLFPLQYFQNYNESKEVSLTLFSTEKYPFIRFLPYLYIFGIWSHISPS